MQDKDSVYVQVEYVLKVDLIMRVVLPSICVDPQDMFCLP